MSYVKTTNSLPQRGWVYRMQIDHEVCTMQLQMAHLKEVVRLPAKQLTPQKLYAKGGDQSCTAC